MAGVRSMAGKIRDRDRDFRATIVKTDHVISCDGGCGRLYTLRGHKVGGMPMRNELGNRSDLFVLLRHH